MSSSTLKIYFDSCCFIDMAKHTLGTANITSPNRGFNIEREDYFKAFRDAERAHGITATAKGE